MNIADRIMVLSNGVKTAEFIGNDQLTRRTIWCWPPMPATITPQRTSPGPSVKGES